MKNAEKERRAIALRRPVVSNCARGLPENSCPAVSIDVLGVEYDLGHVCGVTHLPKTQAVILEAIRARDVQTSSLDHEIAAEEAKVVHRSNDSAGVSLRLLGAVLGVIREDEFVLFGVASANAVCPESVWPRTQESTVIGVTKVAFHDSRGHHQYGIAVEITVPEVS